MFLLPIIKYCFYIQGHTLANSRNENYPHMTVVSGRNNENLACAQPSTSHNDHNNQIVELSQTLDIVAEASFNKSLSDFVLKSMVQFYCKPNTPFSNAEDISQMIIDMTNFINDSLKEGISKCSTLDEAKQLINHVELDSKNFRSIYMFKRHLKDHKVLFESKKFVMHNQVVHYIGDMNNEVELEKYQAVIMPIDEQIRAFLQLPGMLKAIIENQNKLKGSSLNNPISHFCQGNIWKDIVSKNVGKTLIPIMIYNDDFTVDNSIGPHSTDNQISGFYYHFPSLPAHLKSKLQYIFVGMLALSQQIKECTPDSVLYILLHTFSRLETNGLDIVDETGKVHKIYIVLVNVQGDNLGIHLICGFTKGFNSEFFCRFCLTTKTVCQHLCDNKDLELRSVDG